LAAPNVPIARAYHDLVRKIHQSQLLDQLAKLKKPTGAAAKLQAEAAAAGSGPADQKGGGIHRSRNAKLDPWTAMKVRIHKALVEQMDLKKLEADTSDPAQMAVLR